MKKLPFVDFPRDKEMETAPPDGVYAVISYHERGGPFTRHPHQKSLFPWSVQLYVFSDGVCEDLKFSSDIAEELDSYPVKQVFVIGADETRKKELDVMLAKGGIELVPSQVP